ncbi:MAG: protein kinase [Anaerolineales bacterium]|nr:protein kinase [Anaerolineales bacterium]
MMDYIEGQDLESLHESAGGPLPEAQTLGWIGQVCDALDYLHSQNPPVVHRDIKPANIRITPEGTAALVDFGIAKIYDPSLKTTLGAQAVTPGYSPPEQYGLGKTDPRSDIYALGATLYCLLSGREPVESVQRSIGVELPPPRQFNPSISHQAENAILVAMQMAPAQRYQTAADLKADLPIQAAEAGRPPASAQVDLRVITQPLVATPPAAPQVTAPAAAVAPVLPSDRAEAPLQGKPARMDLRRALAVLGGLALVALLAWLVSSVDLSSPSPARPTGTPAPAAIALTPSASPTVTPTPTQALPVSMETPWPTPRESISIASAAQVVELAKMNPWGSNIYTIHIIRQITWPSNQRLLAAASASGQYNIYEYAPDVFQGSLQRAQASGISPGFSAAGDRILLVTRIHQLQIRSIPGWNVLEEWGPPDEGVNRVALSPDGRLAAIASYEGVITLREAGGAYLRTFSRQVFEVPCLAFSPDGSLLASGSDEPSVRIWRISDGVLQHRLRGHTGKVLAVAFAPGGRLLASGSADDSVRIWDLTSGELLQTLQGHTQDVFSLAFSPDGQLLASGSGDNTIVLWQVSNGQRLITLEGPASLVLSLNFSPDGRYLASGSNDGALRIWGIGP